MVQILHQSANDLREFAALRAVPACSETHVADGAFLYMYASGPNTDIYGYYKPETIHAFGVVEDYQVTVYKGRATDCDCPSYAFRGGKGCKHMQEYNKQADDRAALLAAPAKRMTDERRADIKASIAADYD